MKSHIVILFIAFLAGHARGQEALHTPASFQKALAPAGEMAMVNTGATDEELRTALQQATELLPLAPDEYNRNKTRALLAVLHSRLRNEAAALAAAQTITDTPTRLKKEIEIAYYIKGEDACVNELQKILETQPADDRIIYIEKAVNLAGGKNTQNTRLIRLVTGTLSGESIPGRHAQLVPPLLNVCAASHRAGRLDTEYYRKTLESFVANHEGVREHKPNVSKARSMTGQTGK